MQPDMNQAEGTQPWVTWFNLENSPAWSRKLEAWVTSTNPLQPRCFEGSVISKAGLDLNKNIHTRDPWNAIITLLLLQFRELTGANQNTQPFTVCELRMAKQTSLQVNNRWGSFRTQGIKLFSEEEMKEHLSSEPSFWLCLVEHRSRPCW